MDIAKQSQLVSAFADTFIGGNSFDNILRARTFAEDFLNQKIEPGTLAAKLVDECIEQGVVRSARNIALSNDPLVSWSQCLDLYNRQPALNTRTSTSVLQQAYSTPVPIAYLAGTLAGITRETSVYEPAAGNGALLLLADPSKAVVNELNPERARALRAQGFTVTEQDASSFLPHVEPVDRIITNPPFGSLRDEQGQARLFRRGLLMTTQLDHAIALKALDLMKPDGRAVLILGGKMGDERSRLERYNTQLSRGFYRWLYKDAGYKVADHFSIDGSLYRKQGTSLTIDLIVIEGKGETQLKLPGVQPPRIYENYESLKEVLVNVLKLHQFSQTQRNYGNTLHLVRAGTTLDADISNRTASTVDDGASTNGIQRSRELGRVLLSTDPQSGVADRVRDQGLAYDIHNPRREGRGTLGSQGNQPISTNNGEQRHPLGYPARNGSEPGDELSGVAVQMFADRDRNVPSHPLPGSGNESALSLKLC